MKLLISVSITVCIVAFSGAGYAADSAFIDSNGVSHIPSAEIPYSNLASQQQREQFVGDAQRRSERQKTPRPSLTKENAQQINNALNQDAKERIANLNKVFNVTTVAAKIGGVPVYVSTPNDGIAPGNRDLVLIQLHGGSFVVNSGPLAQVGAVPIAGLGKIKVISVDYRQAPAYQYPSATEDVESVYKSLIRDKKPRNVGIFGCSTGALLTAEATARLHHGGLPSPGAIGLFGEGALVNAGDSYFSSMIFTGTVPSPSSHAIPLESELYFPDSNTAKDGLAFPAENPEIIKHFPPTLLISGTRDAGLSQIVVTHARLVKAGVNADLHVWEGTTHCAYASALGTDTPENREAWSVMVNFFRKHLHGK
jgi:monoterpene epsilon-lactone hydrolase